MVTIDNSSNNTPLQPPQVARDFEAQFCVRRSARIPNRAKGEGPQPRHDAMNETTRACYTGPNANLIFTDHGHHCTAQVRCTGPLDRRNIDATAEWARSICGRLNKPLIFDTSSGRALILPEQGKPRCYRLTERRRTG